MHLVSELTRQSGEYASHLDIALVGRKHPTGTVTAIQRGAAHLGLTGDVPRDVLHLPAFTHGGKDHIALIKKRVSLCLGSRDKRARDGL